MARESAQWGQGDLLRRIVPVFAFGVAIVAALTDPSTPGELILMAIPPLALATWTYAPRLPLWAVAIAVVVPVVAVQHSGTHEPIMFEASLLAFVVARWSRSPAMAVRFAPVRAKTQHRPIPSHLFRR